MKKFLYKSIAFIIIFIISFKMFVYATDGSLKKVCGPTTEQQIEQSFNDVLKNNYDYILLGNSRIYRGVNPSIVSSKAYNFAHDNDSFNQAYYKLMYLKEHDKLPKYLILGVDYFQFSFLSDTRNYVYRKYFGREYLNDFNTPLKSEVSNVFKIYQNQSKARIESLFKEKNKAVSYLKDDGQYINYGVATKNDRIKRESNILQVQLDYFDKIIDLCKEKGIVVFLVMPPTRQIELNSYNNDTIYKLNEIYQKKTGKGVYYLNYSKNENFTISDYQDVTHLNIKGADKFSKMLKEDIQKVNYR